MDQPYLSEIRLYNFGCQPLGWALCNGQLLPTSQHPALFSLLGTIYGGDGVNTFALPELRCQVSLHFYICLQGPYPPRS